MFAPYISEDLRLRDLSLLYVGVSVETIMQRHNESVERHGGPCNRDDLLTHRYVRRQERSIRCSTFELDTDHAVSISMWVESHLNQVFFFEDFFDSEPHFRNKNRVAVATNDSVWQSQSCGFSFKVWNKKIEGLSFQFIWSKSCETKHHLHCLDGSLCFRN